MTSQTLPFSITIVAPASEIYRAFTNGTILRDWLCDSSQALPRLGGRLYLWWNNGYYTNGVFTHLEPSEKIMFTWNGRGEPAETRVVVRITPQTEDCLVTLEHCDIGSDSAWVTASQSIQTGWITGLENLKSILETGRDLRFIRRPMLGIGIGEFDESIASKLGIPVKEGIRLDNVIEGMGPRLAGMQKDDVMVSLGGHVTNDWTSLTEALQSHHAGDKIEVVFYRGQEKKLVAMELSHRQLPALASSPKLLSEATEKQYQEILGQLDQLFAGLIESEASQRPVPGEWSVKEILAHLIHSERGWHNAINEIVASQESYTDDFSGNLQFRIDATLAVYPTLTDLLQTLNKDMAETIQLLTCLPADFLVHKSSYWRLAYGAPQTPLHINGHIEQLRDTINSIRSI